MLNLSLRLIKSVLCVVVLGYSTQFQAENSQGDTNKASGDIVKLQEVAESLAPYAENNEFPSRLNIANHGRLALEYTVDPDLHNHIASIYKSYQPDYAVFVAMEPKTGRILALTSYVKDDDFEGNLALKANYPAASLFKVVSAASAIDKELVYPSTVIPFNGKSTTLYKSQVLRHKDNKYTRKMSFSEAFARSSNPVFGRLGVEYLSANMLFDYASKMGFGQRLGQDLPVMESELDMPLIEPWELAEASSGFTRDIKMGPVHAAAMVAGVLNEGKMPQPYVVDRVVDGEGNTVFTGKTEWFGNMFSASTAEKIQAMMRKTTRIGSARRAFARHKRYSAFKGADFGGKTGSLSGQEPDGRYNWFVGYGQRNGEQIAYASMVVYRDKWVVRPTEVAFQVLNYFFKQAEVSKNIETLAQYN